VPRMARKLHLLAMYPLLNHNPLHCKISQS